MNEVSTKSAALSREDWTTKPPADVEPIVGPAGDEYIWVNRNDENGEVEIYVRSGDRGAVSIVGLRPEQGQMVADLVATASNDLMPPTPADDSALELLAELYEEAGEPFDVSSIKTRRDLQRSSRRLGSLLGERVQA